jgi:hypothetical protein
MTKWIASAFLCTGLAFACGGGDDGGVDSNTKVADLTDDEAADECEFLVDEFPARDVDCDGTIVTVGFESEAECLADLPTDPACPATVGQAEDCFDALDSLSDDDLCELSALPSECAPLASAACSND